METKALLLKTLDLIENKNGGSGGSESHIQRVTFVDIYLMIDVISELSKSRRGYLKSFIHRLMTMLVLNLVFIMSMLNKEMFYRTAGNSHLFIKYDWFVELLTLKTSNPLVRVLSWLIKDISQDIHDIYSVMHGGSQVDSDLKPSNLLVKSISILVLFPLKYLSQISMQVLILVSLVTTISLSATWAFLDQTNSDLLNHIEREISYQSTQMISDLMKEIGQDWSSIINYSKHDQELSHHLDNLKVMKEKLQLCKHNAQCRRTANKEAIIDFLDQEVKSIKSIRRQELREVFHRSHNRSGIIRDTSVMNFDK